MGQRNKILFLDHAPIVGGAQLSLIHHLEKLDKNKFETIIGCSKTAEKLGLTDFYKDLKIKYYFLPLERLKIFNPASFIKYAVSIISIFKLIKREKVDLLVSNTVRTALSGSLAAWLTDKKIVWFIRDFTFPLKMFKLFSVFPKKIIFNSRATASYYDGYLKDNSKKEIVYIGRNFFEKAKKISSEEIIKTRELLGARKNTFLIGYLGRLVNWKGPQILVAAVGKLVEMGITNIKCVFAGTGENQEGNNEEELKKIVNKSRLGEYIVFKGYIKDISALLLSLDVFCLTSINPEPFSSAVVDAMMAKVPVIGTNIGGTPEIIIDKETGLLVAPNNADELAQAIENLVKDNSLRIKIIEKAYQLAMRRHTADLTTSQITRIYLETL